jgi:hypothetical protein
VSFGVGEMNNQIEPYDIIVLEWSFSPPNYFEDSIRVERDDYEMIIENGRVEAKIHPNVFENNPTMKDDLTNSLNDRFLGVQLLTHEPYQLSKASMCRLHPDGRRDITVFAEPGIIRVTGTAEIIITDKDGNVIVDSRRDRIEKKKQLSELAEKYRKSDPTVASVLNSYKMAVNEPNNELVHLYEIRDALSKRFGSESAACHALNISSQQWSRLGRLANHESLKQGRHRGKNPGALRDATESELMEARHIARAFVEAYISYLERSNTRNKKTER